MPRPAFPIRAVLVVLFLRAWSFLQRQSRHEEQQERQEHGSNDTRVLCRVRPRSRWDVPVRTGRDGQSENGKLHRDLAKVVWVSGPREQANVACRALVLGVTAEPVLLDIGDGLHQEPNGEHDDADNVRGGTERRMRVFCDAGRVEDRDGKTNAPYPEGLEGPEAQEREEAGSFVVEARVGACLEDSEE